VFTDHEYRSFIRHVLYAGAVQPASSHTTQLQQVQSPYFAPETLQVAFIHACITATGGYAAKLNNRHSSSCMCSSAAQCLLTEAGMSMISTESMVHKIHTISKPATMSCAVHSSMKQTQGKSISNLTHFNFAHREPEGKAGLKTKGIRYNTQTCKDNPTKR
jgi:hypothetical protein